MNPHTELVLLSGGMDSATALADAVHQGTARAALSVNYGQRHARELKAAAELAGHYGVPHHMLDLAGWGQLLATSGSALVNPDVQVPRGHYAAPTMVATIVPNRNATLLNAAAGVAIALDIDTVTTAVHAGDHAIYPDCRPEFIAALNHSLQLSTDGEVAVRAPFVTITKTDIARHGSELGVPYELTWSCYEGGDVHCGQCGTCVERREAFRDAGLLDLTVYADETPVAS